MVQFDHCRVIHPLVPSTFEMNYGAPFSRDTGKGNLGCPMLGQRNISKSKSPDDGPTGMPNHAAYSFFLLLGQSVEKQALRTPR